MIARGAPRTDSMVRRMRSSRAWVSTWMVTSAGMWPPSMRVRTKSKSVCEADGKPTSISLKPISHTVRNMRILRSTFIGSNSAWLPSRRSVLIQTGARSMTLFGHWRSASAIGAKGRYLAAGFCNIMARSSWAWRDSMDGSLRGRLRQTIALLQCERVFLCRKVHMSEIE